MGEITGIAWCDSTFNPWRGCQRVSEGCRHCYAETWAARNPAVFGTWGPDGARVGASDDYWREPERWDRRARRAGRRLRVFCGSLCDWLEDRPDLIAPRARLFDLIGRTPNLEWLLLSKRIENYARLVPPAWMLAAPANVRVGATAEDQDAADRRIPELLRIHAANFVSVEPMLGPVRMRGWLKMFRNDHVADPTGIAYQSVDWVIIGGESGVGARPFELEWARRLLWECRDEGVPAFVKQLGSNPRCGTCAEDPSACRCGDGLERVLSRKGDDPAQWPDDLRVREFPR